MFNRWISLNPKKSCLLIGTRRSGKTTLLKMLYPDYNYITLDDLDYLTWADRDPKGLIEHIGDKAIIDEIQRKPQLSIAVKYAIDNFNARYLMTGSSSVGMLDAASDTLAGRINIFDLPTACFGEQLGPGTHHILEEQLNPSQTAEANRKLTAGIRYGQFPEVLMAKDDSDKENILKNYRDTYFTRDLMQMTNIENLNGLLSIFSHLARSIGSHLEVSNFAREAGMSHPSTKKYLNNLNLSQLTFRLYGYQYGPAKRFIKASKTYFADNGILHSLNIPLNEGQLLENFVIAEFEKRRKLGFLQCEKLYYYRSAAGREIDLVFEAKNHIHAVEIKNTKNPVHRDVRNLLEFSKQLKRKCKLFLFYMGTEYSEIDGVKIMPVSTLFRGI